MRRFFVVCFLFCFLFVLFLFCFYSFVVVVFLRYWTVSTVNRI